MSSEYELSIKTQIKAIHLFAYWRGLTPEAAAHRWTHSNCAIYWRTCHEGAI